MKGTQIVNLDGQDYVIDQTFDGSAAVYRAESFKEMGHVSKEPQRPMEVPLGTDYVVIIARKLEPECQ